MATERMSRDDARAYFLAALEYGVHPLIDRDTTTEQEADRG